MTEPRWYTIKEVAERLRVSHDTVARMVERGELPAIRVSARLVRIPAPALHRIERAAPDPVIQRDRVLVRHPHRVRRHSRARPQPRRNRRTSCRRRRRCTSREVDEGAVRGPARWRREPRGPHLPALGRRRWR